jgi:hypothetical protein
MLGDLDIFRIEPATVQRMANATVPEIVTLVRTTLGTMPIAPTDKAG